VAAAASLSAVVTSSDTPLPRSIRKGPRITLTCECGERQYLHYGEIWTCEKCGRRWNTERIPVEQYAELRAAQLRYRRTPIIVSTLALVCVIAFVIAGRAVAGLIVIALAATTYGIFVRPTYRRRYQSAMADLPTWKIEPD
jgi:Flp pilus assembly protein TadB